MMQGLNNTTRSKMNQNSQGSANPFARALAEVEKTSGGNQPNSLTESFDTLPENLTENNLSPDLLKKQQEEKQKELLKQRRRKELHDRVNPVDAKDVFKAREIQVKKEIDRLRQELKALAQEVKDFHKEVEVTLMTNVGSPGDGSYYLNFFQKLRAFIMLLRQKIRSARTWATQVNNKKRKKKSKRPGLEIGGAKHEKTSTVFEMMHHERSNSYGGS